MDIRKRVKKKAKRIGKKTWTNEVFSTCHAQNFEAWCEIIHLEKKNKRPKQNLKA
jgi:hypothetical protein